MHSGSTIIASAVLQAIEIFAGGFAAVHAIKKSPINEIPHDLTRRKLLQLAFGLGALFGLSNLSSFITLPLDLIEHPNWIKRLKRIEGITSHMHPEQPLLFLRDAIMADKLLLTGNYLKEKLGRQPNIAFWVGAGHSGIEDLLQAGPAFCRKVITLYPEFYLKDLIKRNGGSEDFSSALLAYPRATGENQYAFDLVKITDQELLKRLDT